MYVTIVHVHVKPEHVEEFVEATGENHRQSVQEPGNMRFDILQSVDDPTRFIAYEAYIDEDGAKAHKETAHYLAWRDKVAAWMEEPRQGVRYDGLFPSEAGASR
jgi:autoinducer 2-degrading protein